MFELLVGLFFLAVLCGIAILLVMYPWLIFIILSVFVLMIAFCLGHALLYPGEGGGNYDV